MCEHNGTRPSAKIGKRLISDGVLLAGLWFLSTARGNSRSCQAFAFHLAPSSAESLQLVT